MTIQSHVHIFLTSEVVGTSNHDDTAYPTLGPTSGINEQPTVYAVHERSLTGTSHIHVLKTDAGAVIHFADVDLTLCFITDDQFTALQLLDGQRCYYIPLDHVDDTDYAGHMAAVIEVFFAMKGVKTIDPMMQYRTVQVSLEEIK